MQMMGQNNKGVNDIQNAGHVQNEGSVKINSSKRAMGGPSKEQIISTRKSFGALGEASNMGLAEQRGLNRPNKHKEINLFMHQCKVGLYGLLETKIKRSNAQNASLNLCRGSSTTANLGAHPGGRIWVVWKPSIMQVQIDFISEQVIHCVVMHMGTGLNYNTIFVYEFNDPALRRPLWQEIRKISSIVVGPWAIMGDFNCVLHKEDIIGRHVVMSEIKEFRACVADCGLQKLRSSGAYFTWNNKQEGHDRVYSKIDRVLVNTEWISLLPISEVHYMNEGLYDHCPAIVNWDNGNHRSRRQFKYYNMWTMVHDFKEKVKGSWDTGTAEDKLYQVVGKMNGLKAVLLKLNRKGSQMRHHVCNELVRQGPTITQEQRGWLEHGFSERDIKQAVWAIARDKAPGPDGYGSQFFKDCWEIVGKHVVTRILEFFQDGKMPKRLNATIITLIPKSSHAEHVRDYRPIACSNTIYKVIS
ncbi:uncharacterized protein [Nicotiana tomentosiformis]|uniref:uncharacterized protein n=1 Tax=Nicotiana tomentosiformis TaxID=4098 RepID=UPI00388CCA9D